MNLFEYIQFEGIEKKKVDELKKRKKKEQKKSKNIDKKITHTFFETFVS